MREVDQLHPLVRDNVWLFGESWRLSASEAGPTNVLRATIAWYWNQTWFEMEFTWSFLTEGADESICYCNELSLGQATVRIDSS
jgi:hypothetical protein